MSAGRAWLFVGETGCIWLQRVSEENADLVMHGPGAHRRRYSFADAEELFGFVADAERRLVASGWTMQTFAPGEDRRKVTTAPPVERRRGGHARSA